jgi:phosphate transport system protein
MGKVKKLMLVRREAMRVLQSKLKNIKDDVIEIGNLTQKAVEVCLDGLRGDEEMRKIVSHIEHITDVMNTDVECECLSVVVLFQPVAWDLRFTLSMMRISGNYERIADLAQEIANYDVQSDFNDTMDIFSRIKFILLEMFKIIGAALKTGDTKNLKEELTEKDNEIDHLYKMGMEIIINTSKKNPQTTEKMVDLIIVARHLERIADILTKIGSRLIFIEEGRRVWIK